MKREIYSCDICEKAKDHKELYQIDIDVKNQYPYTNRSVHNKRYDVCSACAVKVGFVRQVIKDNKIENEKVDIKDRLFDIVTEIVSGIIQDST